MDIVYTTKQIQFSDWKKTGGGSSATALEHYTIELQSGEFVFNKCLIDNYSESGAGFNPRLPLLSYGILNGNTTTNKCNYYEDGVNWITYTMKIQMGPNKNKDLVRLRYNKKEDYLEIRCSYKEGDEAPALRNMKTALENGFVPKVMLMNNSPTKYKLVSPKPQADIYDVVLYISQYMQVLINKEDLSYTILGTPHKFDRAIVYISPQKQIEVSYTNELVIKEVNY